MTLMKTSRAAAANGPADAAIAVIPDDAADLPVGVARSLFVGEAGTVTLIDPLGNQVTLTSAASQYHPLRVRRVMAAGTTASGIIALY